MTIKEMFEIVLINSGQFLLDTDCIELDEGKFAKLVSQIVGIYNQYVPQDDIIHVNLASGSRQFTFTEQNTPAGHKTPGGVIPDQVIEAIPYRVSGTRPFLLRDEYRINRELQIKEEFPFVYRKPTLTVPVNAEYELHILLNHRVSENEAGEKEVVSIDETDDAFFDLLTGKFLKVIGRNRRAFTLEALPIATDAVELVSEGDQLMQSTEESLTENDHKWYLAW